MANYLNCVYYNTLTPQIKGNHRVTNLMFPSVPGQYHDIAGKVVYLSFELKFSFDLSLCDTLRGRIKGKFSATNVMLHSLLTCGMEKLVVRACKCATAKQYLSAYNSFFHFNLHSNITMWTMVSKISPNLYI